MEKSKEAATGDKQQEPSSKLESAVQSSKEHKAKAETAPKAAASTTTGAIVETRKAVVPQKPPLWERIKSEAIHFWHGCKLLWIDMKVAYGLCKRLLRGKKLSRREHKPVSEKNVLILLDWTLDSAYFSVLLFSVGSDNVRYVSTGAVFNFRDCPVLGICLALLFVLVPQHATVSVCQKRRSGKKDLRNEIVHWHGNEIESDFVCFL